MMKNRLHRKNSDLPSEGHIGSAFGSSKRLLLPKNICVVCGERTVELRDIDLVLRILIQSELSGPGGFGCTNPTRV
jgi:hypothetical protein